MSEENFTQHDVENKQLKEQNEKLRKENENDNENENENENENGNENEDDETMSQNEKNEIIKGKK